MTSRFAIELAQLNAFSVEEVKQIHCSLRA